MDPKDLIDGGFFRKADLFEKPAAAAGDPEGETFGRYRLLSVLGQGGTSTVFHARDLLLNRDVALKKLKMESGSLAGRFLREAELLANLHHPSIVPVFDLGRVGESVYFTMPLIQGHTLQELITTKRPAPAEAARLIREAAEAVQYAHDHGIIHRDLKPSNIMIDATGRVLVTDFGLGRREGQTAEKRETATGAFMGTLYYMPPEQARGDWEHVDNRSDVYSLGATLYETLTGKPPFEGDSAFEILRKISQDDPHLPGRVVPGMPWDIEVICLRALEKEPSMRYASMREFGEDLGRFMRGEPVLAKRASLVHRLRRKIHRNRFALGVLASSLVLVAGTGLYFQVRHWKDETERKRIINDTRQMVDGKVLAYERGLMSPPRDMTLERDQLGQVEASLAQIFEKHPEIVEALEQIARIRRLRGHNDTALEAINTAIARAGRDAPGRFFMVRAMIRAALWEEEEAALDMLNEEDRRSGLDEVQGAGTVDLVLEDAKEALRRRLDGLDPGWDRFYEAFAEYAQGRYGPCRDACDAILRDPTLAEGLVAETWKLRGKGGLRLGRYAEAAADYAKSWDIRRSDREAYFGEGFALVYQLQMEPGLEPARRAELSARAISAADKARITDPRHSSSFYLRAWIHFYHGEQGGDAAGEAYDAALASANVAIEVSPGKGPTLNLRGLIRRGSARLAMKLGRPPLPDLDLAIEDFDRCIAINARHAVAWGNRGSARSDRARALADPAQQLAEIDKAIADFTEAARLRATKPTFTSNLALARSEKARLLRARGEDPTEECLRSIAAFDEYLKRWPTFERAWHNRANTKVFLALWRAGKGADPAAELAPAFADYDKALELKPDYVEALMNRGLARVERFRAMIVKGTAEVGDAQLAINDFSRVIELKPDHAPALASRGQLHYGLKRWQEAVDDLERALKADPKLPKIYRDALSESRKQLGKDF